MRLDSDSSRRVCVRGSFRNLVSTSFSASFEYLLCFLSIDAEVSARRQGLLLSQWASLLSPMDLVPRKVSSCSCLPCPHCCLQINHDASLEDIKRKVMGLLTKFSSDGATLFQVAILSWVYAWLGAAHTDLAVWPSEDLEQYCVLPGEMVINQAKFFEQHISHLSTEAKFQGHLRQAPPPPPPPTWGSWPSRPASDSGGTSAPSQPRHNWDAAWAAPPAPPRRRTGVFARDSEDEESETVTYPIIQWQAGGSKKRWCPYAEPWQSRLRAALLEDPECIYDIDWNNDEKYITRVDFGQNAQTNMETQVARKIRLFYGN